MTCSECLNDKVKYEFLTVSFGPFAFFIGKCKHCGSIGWKNFQRCSHGFIKWENCEKCSIWKDKFGPMVDFTNEG